MTREDILAMEPGRELDILISKTLMYGIDLEYSTKIENAWLIVEKYIEDACINHLDSSRTSPNGWHCCLGDNSHVFGCKSASEAICKAALLSTLESS
jgi:hypothetical protein